MFLWICGVAELLRGTFRVPMVFAPNLGPFNDMPNHYLARHPTDDWCPVNGPFIGIIFHGCVSERVVSSYSACYWLYFQWHCTVYRAFNSHLLSSSCTISHMHWTYNARHLEAWVNACFVGYFLSKVISYIVSSLDYHLYLLCNMWGYMYQMTYSSWSDREDIFVTLLFICFHYCFHYFMH